MRELKNMNPRSLALRLVFALALAGCKTVPVKGHYNFAEHPGKGLVAFSTRMDAGNTCPGDTVTGELGFRKATIPDEATLKSYASVDAFILQPGEVGEDAIFFAFQTPRPERTVTTYTQGDPTFGDMGAKEERTLPADPPTRFAVQEVPAGHYVLNSVKFFIQSDSGFYKPTTDLEPYAFTVKEGEVVYLGELGVKIRRTQCMLWNPGTALGFKLSVQDEWGRDAAQFKAELHNISPEAVKKRLLQLQ